MTVKIIESCLANRLMIVSFLLGIVMKEQSWTLDTQIEGRILGEFLLEPTRIYVSELLTLLRSEGVRAGVHITGGGLLENLSRVFDFSVCGAKLDSKAWVVPETMQAFCQAGNLEFREAYCTWNMGIGFCLLASAEAGHKLLQESHKFIKIGEIVDSSSLEHSVEIFKA